MKLAYPLHCPDHMVTEPDSMQRGPVFLLADDDRSAADAITGRLFPECYFIVQVTNPRHVRNYAKRLRPPAIFLAEPIKYPKGGAPVLLQRLIGEVGRPVIILSELWSPEEADRWRRLGASDCLPHPTRSGIRLELLRAKMQDLALWAVTGGSYQTKFAPKIE